MAYSCVPHFFAIVCFALSIATPRHAQGLEIDVQSSAEQINVDESITLEITATAAQTGNLEIELPDIDGLVELSRSQRQNTSFSFGGGGQAVVNQKTLIVELLAERPGVFKLEPIIVRAGGKTKRARSITLTVAGDVAAPVPHPEQVGAQEITPPTSAESGVFVRYRVDNPEPFLGQQILVDVDIYVQSKANFSVEEVEGIPDLDGFWKEVIEQPKQLKRRTTRVNGRNYDSYRLWRAALFPIQAGMRTLPPTSITLNENRGLFSAGRRFKRRALPVQINVKELPATGRPNDFYNNNVGQFQISSTLERAEAQVGQGLMFNLTISGTGNLANVKLPSIPPLVGFRRFPETVNDDVQITANGLNGKKMSEMLLVPEQAGVLVIPSIHFSYFDPANAKYQTVRTEELRLTVTESPNISATAPQPPTSPQSPAESKEPQKPLPPAPQKARLQPLRYPAPLGRFPTPPWRDPRFWWATALPALACLSLLILQRIKQRQTTSTQAHFRQILGRFEKANAAAQHLLQKDPSQAFAVFDHALRELVAFFSNSTAQGLTTTQIGHMLEKSGLEPELTKDIMAELQESDIVRYGGGAHAVDLDTVQNRWRRLVENMHHFAKHHQATRIN